MSDPTLNELITATAEARETIREMHAATKDLKQAIKDARRVIGYELQSQVAEKVSSEIRTAIDSELGILSREVRAAMDKAVAKVQAEITKLSLASERIYGDGKVS